MRILFLCVVLFCTAPAPLYARPVSYPGGWTFMQMNDVDRHSLHIHFSPTARYSIGYRGEYWDVDDYWLHSLAVNNLLRRWNNAESQANLYLKSGVGFAYSNEGQFELIADAGVEFQPSSTR